MTPALCDRPQSYPWRPKRSRYAPNGTGEALGLQEWNEQRWPVVQHRRPPPSAVNATFGEHPGADDNGRRGFLRHQHPASMTNPLRIVLLLVLLPLAISGMGQAPAQVLGSWLKEKQAELGLSDKDVAEWTITSSSTDKKGVTYVYIQQHVDGLPVFGAVANFALRDGAVVAFGDRLKRDVATNAPAARPSMDARQALRKAAEQLGLKAEGVRIQHSTSPTELILSSSGISYDPIPARLIHQRDGNGELRLAWDLTIRSNSSPNWWHLAVDASNGTILRTTDHIVQCHHPEGAFQRPYDAMQDLARTPPAAMLQDGSGYRVFAFPAESPIHGPHVLLSEPADPVASPFGWHDMDGLPGAESTTTQGNNTFASEDLADNDMPGYSPDGGVSLNFDFPYTPPQSPLSYLDASITNLFYACNVLHDVWHHYGFDEQSGNFQFTNYSGAGFGNDQVIAQAQDGGGTNNANFGTPPDGDNGRMQMYLWRTSADSTLFVNSPVGIQGVYENAVAGFGPPLPTTAITADVVLVQDDTAPVNNGCETILNGSALAGRIALVDRGQCTFIAKVQALESLGAVAVIVVNNVPGDPIGMGGSGGDDITIPSVMISQSDGDIIKQALLAGAVNATLQGADEEDLRDSSFDNGIIAHEYGHGVSNRLTGGGNNVDCLWNEEQMGEGWSDWMGLILTIRPGDEAGTPRGIGTFVRDQPTSGQGIRPAPYSTDPAVNDYTYGDTNNGSLSQPHGVGFVWATILWDMTWALIEQYGYDTDLYTGEGGNNLAIQLMMDGLKLQACNPGFVDGRDAILLADQLLTGGQNECLLWNAFARRGLGLSADQGSSDSRFDQVEAFDVPIPCLSVGVEEQRTMHSLRLMPNPASGQVRMVLAAPAGKDAELRILAADGRMARTLRVQAGTIELTVDIAGLAPSLYLVELRSEGTVLMERLVVE